MSVYSLVSATRSVIGKWLLVPVLVLLALIPSIVQAGGALYAKPSATGSGDCSSWANACDLQYALNGAASGSEIWVMKGTYKPTTGTDRTVTFQLKSGVALYGGFAGTETSLSQRDWTTNVTVLSGDIGVVGNPSDNSYHVVTGSGTDITAVLDGFTVRDGNANGVSYPDNAGSGMDNVAGSPRVRNDTFSGNSAVAGGGMYNNGSSPTLTNVTFTSNSANDGGGMENESSSSPTLTNVTFTSNFANNGGGMLNGNSSPTLTNVTFTSNSASTDGGGMYNSSSSPTLGNVTFSGNSANTDGGGMYNLGSSPTLANVTSSGNSANTDGGGMYNRGGSPAIRNTILWANTALAGGPQIYNDATSTATVNDSVVQGGCPAFSTCLGIIPQDPHLGPLGDYGGATQTIPLLPGSSAIDAGNNVTCAAAPVNNLDQRGVTRPQGAQCDIGSYESRGFTLTKTGGDNQSTPINTAFALPLQVTFGETSGSGLPGIVITFAAPSSGASASWGGSTMTTQTSAANGNASAPAPTANGTVGSYSVMVSAPGVSGPVSFSLTNNLKPVLFLPLLVR